MVTIKQKRKSVQPPSYSRIIHERSSIELPDIYGSGRSLNNQGIRSYLDSHNNGGANSQLLNRKRSYERMMRIDEVVNGQNGRSEIKINSSNKPRLNVVGGHVKRSQLNTIEHNNNTTSQKRIPQLHDDNSYNQSPLDVTGKNM